MAIRHNPQKAVYYLHRARTRQLLQNILGARLDVATVLLLNPKQPKVGSCWARVLGVGDRLQSQYLPLPKDTPCS